MPKMYFCNKCKRRHRSGKIYEAHREFEKKEEDEIPSNKIIKCDISTLKNIAQRQILVYLRKMKIYDKLRFLMEKTGENIYEWRCSCCKENLNIWFIWVIAKLMIAGLLDKDYELRCCNCFEHKRVLN